MVWKATPEKNSFAIFFSPFGRRGLITNVLNLSLNLLNVSKIQPQTVYGCVSNVTGA